MQKFLVTYPGLKLDSIGFLALLKAFHDMTSKQISSHNNRAILTHNRQQQQLLCSLMVNVTPHCATFNNTAQNNANPHAIPSLSKSRNKTSGDEKVFCAKYKIYYDDRLHVIGIGSFLLS